jgi:hypothetical protein
MPAQDLASLIRSLADPDTAIRQDSAAAIFQRGSALLAPLLKEWLADPELAQHILANATLPRLTVGLAVAPVHFGRIRSANGSPCLADVPPDQDAQEFELDFDRGIRLDILTSRDPHGAGPLGRYLRKFGEGIQQIEVTVSSVDRASELLRLRFGLQPIYPTTRAGANGTRVNFFLVSVSPGGKILIELVQS